jgi:hypothetical protein
MSTVAQPTIYLGAFAGRASFETAAARSAA